MSTKPQASGIGATVDRVLPTVPLTTPRTFPITEETAREHIANAIQIVNGAPRTALNGKYLSPADATALTTRLVRALEQLDRKVP